MFLMMLCTQKRLICEEEKTTQLFISDLLKAKSKKNSIYIYIFEECKVEYLNVLGDSWGNLFFFVYSYLITISVVIFWFFLCQNDTWFTITLLFAIFFFFFVFSYWLVYMPLVHRNFRLHAQALTLAALAGAAVVEYYDHRTGKKEDQYAKFLPNSYPHKD